MGKPQKNKLKILNKLAKSQASGNLTNKIIKKKQNAEKKVTFKKEVLLKEAAHDTSIAKNISRSETLLKNLFKKPEERKQKLDTKPPKVKSVEKQKKRQKTQINDTKLLLKLMRGRK